MDLLPDQEAETLANRFRTHPGVQIVSRDRGGTYAEGVRNGAPGAIQVADRWHLLKNLGEAVQALLTRHLVAFRRTKVSNAQHSEGQTQMPGPPIKLPVKVMPALVPIREAREEVSLPHFRRVSRGLN